MENTGYLVTTKTKSGPKLPNVSMFANRRYRCVRMRTCWTRGILPVSCPSLYSDGPTRCVSVFENLLAYCSDLEQAARGICGHARAWNLKLGGVEVSQGSREYNSNVLLKRRIMANTWFCFLCLIWRFDEERVSTNDTKRGATGKNLRTSALGAYADTLYTK